MSKLDVMLPKNIVKKANDAYLTILALIDFIKKYDKKFEEFISISSISLTNPIDDEDRSYIMFTLSDCAKTDCAKIPLDKLPNINEFRQMLIKKWADPKKFDVKINH